MFAVSEESTFKCVWGVLRTYSELFVSLRKFSAVLEPTCQKRAQVSLDLLVISDSIEDQTDFSCFLVLSTVVIRPRSH